MVTTNSYKSGWIKCDGYHLSGDFTIHWHEILGCTEIAGVESSPLWSIYFFGVVAAECSIELDDLPYELAISRHLIGVDIEGEVRLV